MIAVFIPTASDDDYKIIAIICWFYQSLLMQSFFFFTCLLIQIFGGRGTKSASRLFKNLTVVPFKNNQRSPFVLQIAVVRNKTQREFTFENTQCYNLCEPSTILL